MEIGANSSHRQDVDRSPGTADRGCSVRGLDENDLMAIPEICLRIQGRLVVSCQAEPRDAFYGLMDRFARAAVVGGAAGIRANGLADIRAIRKAVDVPIIGIQKSLHSDGQILITPTFEAAAALVKAGADMIAFDCTSRG